MAGIYLANMVNHIKCVLFINSNQLSQHPQIDHQESLLGMSQMHKSF